MDLRAFQNRFVIASLLATKLGEVLSKCPDLLTGKTPAEYAERLSENEWVTIAKHAGRPGYLPSEETRAFVVVILKQEAAASCPAFVSLLKALSEVKSPDDSPRAA